jgi:cysteine desulfurase
MAMRTIYFDYNATTPLDPAVRAEMRPCLDGVWGNPSSVHHVGRQARAALDDARERTANVLRCKPSEVVFTSGGSESVNLAILGTARALRAKGHHIITSAIEHHAVLHACDYLAAYEGFAITHLPVNAEGRLSPDALTRALRPDTVLVSVMAANNEIGTLQPVAELGALCRARGVVFYTDAAQWIGKEPFSGIDQFNADLVSICAHKFHGPKGAGALYIRSPLQPHPILFGGAHENERRAGTENLAAILGFTAAVERFVATPVFPPDALRPLTASLIHAVEDIAGVRFVGSRTQRLANTAAFVVDGADSISLLAALDLEGICASGGAACSAGSLKPSHVIQALGLDSALAQSLLRFSLGRSSTTAEVKFLAGVLPEIVKRAQRYQQTPAGL